MGTRDQLKYAQERLKQIYQVKKQKIIEETISKIDLLTYPKLVDLIKAGKVKLNPCYNNDEREVNGYDDIKDTFDLKTHIQKPKVDEKERKKRVAALDKEYTKVMDELMLGDMETALKLVQEFDKESY